MWNRHFDKSPYIRFAIYGLVAIVCGVEATYNGGIKTRTYTETDPQLTTHTYTTHHRTHQFAPVNGGEYQYSHGSSHSYGHGNDNDYQPIITSHQSRGASTAAWAPSSHGPRDASDSYHQQQHEGDYYQHHGQQQQQQPQPQPLPYHHHHGYRQHNYHNQQQSPQQQQVNYGTTHSKVQLQAPAERHDSENSITDYYTGCPSGHTGQLPYAYDCRRFLNCWRGRGHIQTCSVGTVFNPETLECDRPDKVRCGVGLALGAQTEVTHTTSQGQLKQKPQPNYRAGRYTDMSTGEVDILCPPDAQGLQPHPSDCTKFINCANGNVHIQDCGPGTAFSISMKVCDFKEKVDCTGRGATAVTSVRQAKSQISCPADASGLYPHPSDCSKFLQCANGQTHVQDCGPGTAFDSVSLICDFKNKVNCASGSSWDSSKAGKSYGEHAVSAGANTNSKNVECPRDVSGLYAHPYDCEKFLQCSNGETYIQNCGPGTGFDSVRLLCDYKEKVHCSSGSTWSSTGGGSTTDHFHTRQTTSTSSSKSSPGDPNDLPHNADILCLNGITGIFPYPFDYTKFINCKNGNTAIQNCVHGTAFSISKGFCESLDQIEKSDHVMYIVSEMSYEYSQTLITCPPGTEGLHLYPFNAEKYVRCVSSQMEVASCSPSKVFSTTRRLCLPTDQVLKNERVRLLSELQKSNAYRFTDEFYDAHTMVYCPLGLAGTYPHPFENSKYIRCGGGRMLRESCASGKAYSLSRKECDMKEDIESSDRVPQSQMNYGRDWRVTDMETTFGSTDGLTYLMCPPGLSGYFLHPFDCTKYLQCENGATKVESCLNGSVFSISSKECIPRDRVEAYDRVEYLVTTPHELSNERAIYPDQDLGVNCSPGTFGIYPHPQDYRMYVRCANGRISVENCAPGQVFSIERSFCHNENEVSQHDRSSYTKSQGNGQHSQIHYTQGGTGSTGSTTTTTTTSTGNDYNSEAFVPEHKDINCPAGNSNGRYAHPYDCTKFIMCSNGEAHVQSCGPGTAWSKAMEVCDFKDKVDCSQTGPVTNTQQPEILCPAGVEGLFEHPYDWHKYLSCNHGRTHIMDCGPGTVFSLGRKICDLEANVVNTDRCNNGVYRNDYDYSYTQNTNDPPKNFGTGPTHWTYTETQHYPATLTYTQTQENANNRWNNMNVPRPQGATYPEQQSGTWHHSSNGQHSTTVKKPQTQNSWTSTAINVEHQTPTQTIIYEEGSLQPDRNYNQQMFNTPLAPLAPGTAGTSTTSTIVYAQPVGSQEDSQEVFDNIQPIQAQSPYHNPQTHRQNFTRNLQYMPFSNTWVPIPSNTKFGSPPPQVPVTTYLMPPLEGTVQTPGLVPLQPLNPSTTPPRGTHSLKIPTRPQHPSGSYIPLPITHLMPPMYANDDRGQRPLTETGHTVTTINVDHLSGQPTAFDINELDVLPSDSRKVLIVDDSNLYGGLQPPYPNVDTTSTQHNYIDVYEQTTQIPRPSEATTPITLIQGYPKLSNATIQTFPNQPHYSHGYSEVTHSRNVSNSGRKIPQHSSIKPTNQGSPTRLESTKKSTDEIVTSFLKAKHYNQTPLHTEHVDETKVDFNDPQNLPLKEALQIMLRPYLNHSGTIDDAIASKAQSHIMNLVSTADKGPEETTTTHNPLHPTTISSLPSTTLHPDDVELILAGEQHHLVSTSVRPGSHETSTIYETHGTTVQSQRSTSAQTHDHNSNWHKHHQHNPSSSKIHSREFHEKHPNLPNPFEKTQNTLDIDLRSGDDCPFSCGNGRCIQRHEVCNGVNNCGNRKDELQCEHLGYEVRLTGGESSNMGRVEVKILGKWGYVCDDKFGLKDADVLCRELGFKMGAMEVRGSSYYPPTDINTSFTMDEVECKGNETSLRECDFKGWGVNNCGPDEVVGVVCKVQKMKCPDNYWLCSKSEECIPTAFVCDLTPDCSDGADESPQVCNAPIQYRLEGGRTKNEGRLEVFYRGEWGTVCDDDFSLKEAQVVCNSLGFYGKPEVAKNIYGPGSGPIWLDQVSCLGNETRLDKCNHWTWGENNCQHTEDVGLKCTAGPKLVQPTVPSNPTTNTELTQYELEYEQSELDDLGKYQGLWQRSSKAVHNQKQCGHFKVNIIDEYAHPEERVINGSIAKRGRHPWQATIRTRGRGGISSHWCGAVIISKKLVLTAAHCLAGYPKGSYFVRMGDHYANIAEASEIDSNIENWYIHEKFRDLKHMNNDIALILLKTPVRFNDYVQPICLPDKGAQLEANRICTISGWGSIKSGTSTPSNILRAAEVPILAENVCSRKDVYANAMSEGMFCAGFLDENADACDGDSGGPLVCHDDGGETLYGIISWGQHCGYKNHPGVYVRVEKYIDWIYEKINLMIQQGKL